MSVIWIGVVGAFVTTYIIVGASPYIIMNNQIQVVNFCIKFLAGARQTLMSYWSFCLLMVCFICLILVTGTSRNRTESRTDFG